MSKRSAQDYEIEAWVNPEAWGDMEAAHRTIERIKSESRDGTDEDWIEIAEQESGKS